MKLITLFLIISLLVGGSLAAQTKINASTQINWTGNIGSQIHGVTNGTAMQDVITRSQMIASDYTYNVQLYGACGNGSYDDASSIQDAINATSAVGGGTIFCPPGNYSLESRNGIDDTGEVDPILSPRNGTHLVGVPGKTIFRLGDNMRTATLACPLYANFGLDMVENWSVSGIVFDGNSANNPMQPASPKWDLVGAVYARDVRIEDCDFVNITGAWCINLGSHNLNTDCKNAVIRGNRVSVVGNDSLMDDFTAFYIGVDNAIIEDNVFDSPTRVGILGNAAAIEFHAMNCQISNNIVKNFGVGMYVQSDGMDTGQSVMRIHDNTITGLNRTGINVANWAGKAFDVVDIQDNIIVYNSSDVGNPGAVGIIHFFSTPGAEPTRLLTIKGNKIVGPGWGLYLNNASTSIITDNDFVNCTGYAIKGDFKTPVDYLDISRNVMNGVAFVSGQKIAIRSDFTSDCHNLVIAGNNIVNRTDVDQPEYGAVVNMATNGTTINATIEGNVLQGMKYMEAVVLGYPDAATSNVICRINYPSAPAIGWWSVGSHIRETTPASAAPPGWYCTVEGSPGTWVAEANLA